MKLSFVIITLNEELSLPRCLRSCSDLADEVVVLDSGSTDRTAQVASQYGARWHEGEWLGYVGQKNKAISLARNNWVFCIDADEELSTELRAEVRTVRQEEPGPTVSAYSMPRCVFYEGRWIRHGDWYPDRLVRMFRRDRGQFAGAKVHERVEVSGRVLPLRGNLHHFSFSDARDHWARCQHYARLWAESQHEVGRRASPLASHTHALFGWLRAYVLRLGFMDGRQGWRIALITARMVVLKYRLLRQMQQDAAKS